MSVSINIDELHGHPRFYELLEKIAKLHNDKNKDYATQAEPLQNFTDRAEIDVKYGTIPEGPRPAFKICMNDLMKQLVAALKLSKYNQEGQVEGVPKRLEDVAVYSLLAIILYEENK